MPISRSRCSFQLGKNLLAKNNAVGWFLLVVWGWGGVTHHREIDQSIFHAFKEEEKKILLAKFLLSVTTVQALLPIKMQSTSLVSHWFRSMYYITD